MSNRLCEAMKTLILKEGSTGRAKLGAAVGRGERMIQRYLKGDATPSPDNAYKLARECGLDEADALAIARECESWKGQRTA